MTHILIRRGEWDSDTHSGESKWSDTKRIGTWKTRVGTVGKPTDWGRRVGITKKKALSGRKKVRARGPGHALVRQCFLQMTGRLCPELSAILLPEQHQHDAISWPASVTREHLTWARPYVTNDRMLMTTERGRIFSRDQPQKIIKYQAVRPRQHIYRSNTKRT